MTVPAAFPADEAQRIAELHDYCILDTAPDERFDRITALAAELYDAPIALVSLVDTERQWFKSCLGLPVRETPRDIAFCGHTILSDTPFVVENALEHALFRDNPLVRGDPQIRFYAGVPLTGRNGHRLGSFCIIDRRPRQLAAHEILRLTKLAEIVVDELELHKAQMEAERTLAAQTAANQLKNKFLSSMSHEFRTPLNAILGFSQILEMNARGMLNRDELGYVAAIKAAGDTLLQLSDGMLTMAQLEAGAVPFEIERLSAQEIIGDAFRQHHPTAVMNRLTRPASSAARRWHSAAITVTCSASSGISSAMPSSSPLPAGASPWAAPAKAAAMSRSMSRIPVAASRANVTLRHSRASTGWAAKAPPWPASGSVWRSPDAWRTP